MDHSHGFSQIALYAPQLIDIDSDDPFGPQEFRCLLQALLSGTLLPSQYSGRMLPYGLISFLRSHVDTAAYTRFQYALMRLDNTRFDIRLFWPIIECDTIIDLAANVFTDLEQWFTTFSTAPSTTINCQTQLSLSAITSPTVTQ